MKKIAVFIMLLLSFQIFCSCTAIDNSSQMTVDYYNEQKDDGNASYLGTTITDSYADSSSPSGSSESSGSSSYSNTETNPKPTDSSNPKSKASTKTSSNSSKANSTNENNSGSTRPKESSASTSATKVTAEKPKPTAPPATGNNLYTPLNYSTQKAMWYSYLELPALLQNKTEAAYKTAVTKAFKEAKDLGINTVYFHVRAFGDAIYDSDYFPWSRYCKGSLDSAPSYDPLEIAVNVAHELGLSFHAWINPMRTYTDSELNNLSSGYKIKQWYNDSSKRGKYLIKVDGRWWLNPGYSQVRQLIADGVEEIVSNYKVDGIHFDDYFYPTTAASFDKEAFASSSYSNLSQFRLDNCSQMVKSIYQSIKSINNKVLFGISPQGNIQNNYDFQMSDVKRWASEPGYIDYICPQIYFSYTQKINPFASSIKEWEKLVTNKNVKLVIGLASYKFGLDGWTDTDIYSKMIASSKALSNYGGVALYDHRFTFGLEKNNVTQAKFNSMFESLKKALKN